VGSTGQKIYPNLTMKELDLNTLFTAALKAADPYPVIPSYLPKSVKGRIVVVGAGKASARMAMAVEEHFGDCSGVIVVPKASISRTKRIKTVFAAHPVPDLSSERAAQILVETVSNLREEDLVIALISGGGSSLVTMPTRGITLLDKQKLTTDLLRCGASIGEINLVRQSLSEIKGGGLARAAAPATILTLIVSDVPGNDPSLVASGPTIPAPRKSARALSILKKYEVIPPKTIYGYLVANPEQRWNTPKNSDHHVVLTAAQMLLKIQKSLQKRGFSVINLGDAVEGEAQNIAGLHAKKLLSAPPGTVLLSGGELTVKLGKSFPRKGGRNTEYLLALALELENRGHLHAIACDTDGIDGSSIAAGAIIDPETLTKMRRAGINPKSYLSVHASAEAFELVNALIVTGPTGTNLNDFRCAFLNTSSERIFSL
jgi:glycerate 2-kinase